MTLHETLRRFLPGHAQASDDPPGLLAHVCFGAQGDLRVSEVWESREQQEQFSQALLPMLEEEGIGFAGEPR